MTLLSLRPRPRALFPTSLSSYVKGYVAGRHLAQRSSHVDRPPSSDSELAEKLVKDGPHKKEPANRRVRALLGGKWIFDTLDAQYVWEHPYCRQTKAILYFVNLLILVVVLNQKSFTVPFFYIPFTAIEAGPGRIWKQTPEDSGYWAGSILSGNDSAKATGYVKGPLEGLVKIRVSDAGPY